MVVESHFYCVALGIGAVGEHAQEVLANDALAIMHHVEHQPAQAVAQYVKP